MKNLAEWWPLPWRTTTDSRNAEDLVAGSLELMSGGKEHTLRKEGWYTQALAAASATPGDLRMVMNMEKIAVTPHFRTYWVQQNITEMQSYSSAVSDLYREGPVYREERVILPKKQPAEEGALAQSAQAVSNFAVSVPRNTVSIRPGQPTQDQPCRAGAEGPCAALRGRGGRANRSASPGYQWRDWSSV